LLPPEGISSDVAVDLARAIVGCHAGLKRTFAAAFEHSQQEGQVLALE
jgi:hypothetical protein